LKVGYGLFVFDDFIRAKEEIRSFFFPAELWEVEVLEKDVLPRQVMSMTAREIYQVLYEELPVSTLPPLWAADMAFYNATRTVKKLKMIKKIS